MSSTDQNLDRHREARASVDVLVEEMVSGKSPGRYCIQLGRRLPTEFHEDLDVEASFYWMEPTTAALFNKARTASGS